MRIKSRPLFAALCAASLLPAILPLSAHAQRANIANVQSAQLTNTAFDFTPRPTRKTRLDYEVWDELLESMVLYTGPSTRRLASAPRPQVGTRIVRGHKSPIRMEGNKIPFSAFENGFVEILSEYRQDLEQIGNRIDIPSLSRTEQLVYWYNLHNVTMIEQIALQYPVQVPERMRVGPNKQPLHDAKILNVGGTALSLRDIREKIVYPNWNNPYVIYGFWLGDLSSPSIANFAFSSDNTDWILKRNAREYVNSLRGFRNKRGTTYVSQLYQDVQRFYFNNFQTDLTNHFRNHMEPAVFSAYDVPGTINFLRYEKTIADLTAGYGKTVSASPVKSNGQQAYGSLAVTQFIRDLQRKREVLKSQGRITRGSVVIEDLPSSYDDNGNYVSPYPPGRTDKEDPEGTQKSGRLK